MKIVRTNLSRGAIVLLVILAILFAFIVVPVLLCLYVYSMITGRSPIASFLQNKARRRSRIYEGPFGRESGPQDDDFASADRDDDTIECKVVSARTLDENGQEIR